MSANPVHRTTDILEREWLLIEIAATCGRGSPEVINELVLAYPSVEVWRMVADAFRVHRGGLRSPLGYLRKVTGTAARRVGTGAWEPAATVDRLGAAVNHLLPDGFCWECGERIEPACDNDACPHRKG